MPNTIEDLLSITFDLYSRFHDCPWDYFVLSNNPAITIEFINKNPDKLWSFTSLSENHLITETKIKKRIYLERVSFIHYTQQKFGRRI